MAATPLLVTRRFIVGLLVSLLLVPQVYGSSSGRRKGQVNNGESTSSPAIRPALEAVPLLPPHEVVAISDDPHLTFDLSPRQFEILVASLLSGLGFEDVVLTQTSHDGGVDVLATLTVLNKRVRFSFECKRYKEKVGVEYEILSIVGFWSFFRRRPATLH